MSKSQRKLVFFTSDWHIGHTNVLVYDKRPFESLDEMHRKLVSNFNSTVPEGSITYFLGDMGLGSGDTVRQVVSQLHGTKVLILGNHDQGVNKMYSMGFDVVLYGATLYIANEKVTLTHCPLKNIQREDIFGMKGATDGEYWHGSSRHEKYACRDEGQYHLHGHIHSPNGGKSQKIQGKQYDVGVAANKYRPVSISAIESWIALSKK